MDSAEAKAAPRGALKWPWEIGSKPTIRLLSLPHQAPLSKKPHFSCPPPLPGGNKGTTLSAALPVTALFTEYATALLTVHSPPYLLHHPPIIISRPRRGSVVLAIHPPPPQLHHLTVITSFLRCLDDKLTTGRTLPPPCRLHCRDPRTRSIDDDCLMHTSLALNNELHEWEATATVSWVLWTSRQPWGDEFRLHPGEVILSTHHPEAFFIKFLHCRHCTEALQKGFMQQHSIKVHFIKWQSLKHAQNTSLMFRVKLCLDGVPWHGSTLDICALGCIETNLCHPTNTRTIDLCAWTMNPSLILKRI
uniref:Uncharacterized protein n=1 Tax=Oryza punctata TaxID=4537 RepID=A0A0E0LU49_ORYPU